MDIVRYEGETLKLYECTVCVCVCVRSVEYQLPF